MEYISECHIIEGGGGGGMRPLRSALRPPSDGGHASPDEIKIKIKIKIKEE